MQILRHQVHQALQREGPCPHARRSVSLQLQSLRQKVLIIGQPESPLEAGLPDEVPDAPEGKAVVWLQTE